jgi:ferredoxin
MRESHLRESDIRLSSHLTPSRGKPLPHDHENQVAEMPVPETVVIRLERRKHTISYQPGDTILETARRGGLRPPFSCEAGNCATCMAHLDAGSVQMRANNALADDEVAQGWILTCQSVPTSAEIVVDYDL